MSLVLCCIELQTDLVGSNRDSHNDIVDIDEATLENHQGTESWYLFTAIMAANKKEGFFQPAVLKV